MEVVWLGSRAGALVLDMYRFPARLQRAGKAGGCCYVTSDGLLHLMAFHGGLSDVLRPTIAVSSVKLFSRYEVHKGRVIKPSIRFRS